MNYTALSEALSVGTVAVASVLLSFERPVEGCTTFCMLLVSEAASVKMMDGGRLPSFQLVVSTPSLNSCFPLSLLSLELSHLTGAVCLEVYSSLCSMVCPSD